MNDIVYEEQKQLIKMWKDKYDEKKVETKRLNSIIKEAREYCNFGIKEWITDDGFVEEVLKDVKEILEKAEKE